MLSTLKVDREALQVQKDGMMVDLEAAKEEKKKLEYIIYDLLKAGDGNKEKLKKIRDICDA